MKINKESMSDILKGLIAQEMDNKHNVPDGIEDAEAYKQGCMDTLKDLLFAVECNGDQEVRNGK